MRYCVVNNCPGKSGTGVSFYTFPRDVEQREKWVQFVRRSGRPDWVTKKRSELCSLHFSTDCYSENPDYLEMFGLSKRHAFLLPGSLPTILPDATATTIRRRRKRDPGSGAESVVRAIDSADFAIEPTSEDLTLCPPPRTASPEIKERTPLMVRRVDVRTQVHVHVALKSTQVTRKLKKTRSVGVQAGGPTAGAAETTRAGRSSTPRSCATTGAKPGVSASACCDRPLLRPVHGGRRTRERPTGAPSHQAWSDAKVLQGCRTDVKLPNILRHHRTRKQLCSTIIS